MTAPDFPNRIPAAGTDDPAKPWRVVNADGNRTDYGERRAARAALLDSDQSCALYMRPRGSRSGAWRLYETLLREG